MTLSGARSFRTAFRRFVLPFRKEIAMQIRDRESQSTEYFGAPTEEPKDPVAAELSRPVAATESISGATTRTLLVTVESTRQLFRRARLLSRSLWQRLRDQRREAAAAVVMIVIAMVWFDLGRSGTSTPSGSPNELESYDSLLSDFEPVGEDQTMRESSDLFEMSNQNSLDGGLYSPQTEGSFQSDTFSAKNASAVQTSADYGFGQQQPRKVKFAGRIQPAN
jgi:hypothetical protein